MQASAPIDAADRTDSFRYTVTDSAGADGGGTVSLTVHAPDGPAAAGPRRRGDDEPGPGA